MHVPGTQNKVADCLSRYYKNDTSEDVYGPYDFVRADVRLDPELEDMTRVCAEELRALQPEEVAILARQVSDPLEDRIVETALLDEHSEELVNQGFDREAISLEDSLKSREQLVTRLEGNPTFLDEVRKGYHLDSIFAKVIESPEAHPQFRVEDGLVFARNVAGDYCLGVPREARLQNKRALTEIVMHECHTTVGHFGEDKTASQGLQTQQDDDDGMPPPPPEDRETTVPRDGERTPSTPRQSETNTPPTTPLQQQQIPSMHRNPLPAQERAETISIPGIGKALAREIAMMAAGEEREELVESLRAMDPVRFEVECNLARDREVLRRIDGGMEAAEAMAMDSGDEEDDEDRDVGTPPTRPTTPTQATTPRVPASPPSQRSLPGASSQRQEIPTRPPSPPPPPPAALQSKPRPLVMVLQRPECNREAEGPLQDSGPDDGGLQRPETNREAEGPLMTMQMYMMQANDSAGVGGRHEEGAGPLEEDQNKETAAEGKTGSKDDEGGLWDMEETDGWSEELKLAWVGFARGKDWGGEEWDDCVQQLVAFERAWGFAAKGLLSAPSGKRSPDEVPAWMRARRKWDVSVELESEIGPRNSEESFAARWWSWWAELQPAARKIDEDDWVAPGKLQVPSDWDDVAKTYGRNGLLLYVGGLLWWGEAAAAVAEEDEEEAETLLDEWRQAVKDVSEVLVEVVKRVGPIKKSMGPPISSALTEMKGKRKTRGAVGKAPAAAKKSPPAPTKSAPAASVKSRKRKSASDSSADSPEVDKENARPRLWEAKWCKVVLEGNGTAAAFPSPVDSDIERVSPLARAHLVGSAHQRVELSPISLNLFGVDDVNAGPGLCSFAVGSVDVEETERRNEVGRGMPAGNVGGIEQGRDGGGMGGVGGGVRRVADGKRGSGMGK
ncbi:hypothetical protein C8R43DRAFT_940774 [Mycena crocata]|nr:hypothetical protein C8R43DRAFT_940774 [Mycena crocata]